MFIGSIYIKRKTSQLSLAQKHRNFSTLVCPKTGLKAKDNEQPKAYVINGKEIANKIKKLLKNEIIHLKDHFQPSLSPAPKLGYVLVGNRPDSELYVKMKKRACKTIGIDTTGKTFHEKTSQEEIADYVSQLNEDPSVDGILVQLPLPDHIDSTTI